MKRKEVLQKLQQQYRELELHYGVNALFIFGSIARDEARSDSDVDLLVDFKEPIGLFQFIELQQKLESLLGCKVDLGTKRSLKPHIKNEVLREAIRVE
jgi:predicted nucleotidyltransferase